MGKSRSGDNSPRAVIFDLDLTLVDSSAAAALRKARQWQDVYPLIPQFPVYAGINELLKWLAKEGVPVAIATTSPRPYCTRVLAHNEWAFQATTCYHDTNNHKPHPDPITRTVKLLGVDPARVLSVGDDPKDIQASRSAGVVAVAACWGCEVGVDLNEHRPDHLCETVADLDALLKTEFDKN